MALIKKVNVLDYVPFTPSASLDITKGNWEVDVEHMQVLEACKSYGVKLVADASKSQGIDVCNRYGRVLGHVRHWQNSGWLHEILTDLAELAAEPAKYGLNRL